MEHAAFRRELVGGRLRWLFSILAAVSMATFFWTLREPDLEVWFPFHAQGRALQWAIAIGALLWVLLAVINWRNWLSAGRES